MISYYGDLSYSNGKLVDEKGAPIDGRFEMVDNIKDDLGIVATIFCHRW